MTFRVGILGGGLQGVEACCLARWAGWSTALADSRPQAPASSLAGTFLNLNIDSLAGLDRAFSGCDLVVPACEDGPTLELLSRWGRAAGNPPVAFDLEAYRVSSDKALSKELFIRAGVPTPLAWPEAAYPLIAKPVSSSGSRGVNLLQNEADFKRLFPGGDPTGWIVEQYCPGPSFSIEVTGRPGHYQAWLTTALEMDEVYDCRQVRAPAGLSPADDERFREISLAAAEALGLTGLMDVEVILAPQGLKVLEIDARLPSQTPAVVYWSSGENILVRLAENFCSPPAAAGPPVPGRAVIYEHVSVTPEGLTLPGEHIMAAASPLALKENFHGADWAVTDFAPGLSSWAATIIIIDRDENSALARREDTLKRLGALK